MVKILCILDYMYSYIEINSIYILTFLFAKAFPSSITCNIFLVSSSSCNNLYALEIAIKRKDAIT